MDASVDAEAVSKLRDQLAGYFQHAHYSKAPILTHLNADTTWLLSLPYPDQIDPPPGRSRYNILIDPWLDGPQEDVASWFSKQWHLIQSSIRTIAELNNVLRDAETAGLNRSSEIGRESKSYIDAIAISHEFTDHCHRATLLDIDPSVPVFATTKAARLIRTWSHFESVSEMSGFTVGTDWRSTSSDALPSWIGISRLVTSADALYYHSAVVICV